jgi:hypothetical protein
MRAFGANEQAGAAHFITYGYNEGRTTTFDCLAYIAQYTDLMKAFGANSDLGATHYIAAGFSEGRSAAFNVSAYESVYPDLAGKYASNDAFLTAFISTYNSTGKFLTWLHAPPERHRGAGRVLKHPPQIRGTARAY